MAALRRLAGVLFATLAGAPFSAGCGDGKDQAPPPAQKTAQLAAAANSVRPQPRSRPAGVIPAFRMVGGESGLAFERHDDIRGLRRIIEANGGGAAIFDFDGDGLLDVFLTNGCRLPREPDDRRTPSQLFRNRGGMQFERVTIGAGLAQYGYATGCAVGDFNADGFDDLYVAAFGPNTMWRNNGDGTFADITGETGTAAPQWSSSVAFADVNGDGHLDLYVVNYLEESDASPRLCPNPASPDGYEQCPPALFEGADDVLFLSDGAGGFVDVTAAAGLAGLRGKGLGVVISDFDSDGRPEIFVANDGEANFLFAPVPEGSATADRNGGAPNRSAIRFRDQALASGVALNAAGYAQANMGIAAGDFDANATLDLFITTFYGDTNTLYANHGGLAFEDITRTTGLGAVTRDKLGFGTVFMDADNDGWLDLFVANGHVDDRTWMAHGEPYRMRPRIYRNERDGSFTDVSDWSGEYFVREWLGRGVAVGDLDRDGKLDAVISHQLASSTALHNETPTDNAALVIRLAGTISNRNGYGARVTVIGAAKPLVRELVSGGSFQSASAPEIHLGIVGSAGVRVRIQWPSGLVEEHAGLVPGQWLAVENRGLRRRAT